MSRTAICQLWEAHKERLMGQVEEIHKATGTKLPIPFQGLSTKHNTRAQTYMLWIHLCQHRGIIEGLEAKEDNHGAGFMGIMRFRLPKANRERFNALDYISDPDLGDSSERNFWSSWGMKVTHTEDALCFEFKQALQDSLRNRSKRTRALPCDNNHEEAGADEIVLMTSESVGGGMAAAGGVKKARPSSNKATAMTPPRPQPSSKAMTAMMTSPPQQPTRNLAMLCDIAASFAKTASSTMDAGQEGHSRPMDGAAGGAYPSYAQVFEAATDNRAKAMTASDKASQTETAGEAPAEEMGAPKKTKAAAEASPPPAAAEAPEGGVRILPDSTAGDLERRLQCAQAKTARLREETDRVLVRKGLLEQLEQSLKARRAAFAERDAVKAATDAVTVRVAAGFAKMDDLGTLSEEQLESRIAQIQQNTAGIRKAVAVTDGRRLKLEMLSQALKESSGIKARLRDAQSQLRAVEDSIKALQADDDDNMGAGAGPA